MSTPNPESSKSILDKVKPLLEKVKPVLEKVKPALQKAAEKIKPALEKVKPALQKALEKSKPVLDKIKEWAIIAKNFAIKMWQTQRPIAIAVVSVVVLSTVLLAVFAGGGKKADKSENGGYPDSPKAVGVAFMEACVNQDGATACSYMPDFIFNGKKDQFVSQYTDALKYLIKTYYTNLGMELGCEHRQTYINLDNQEKSAVLQKLKKFSGFDEKKVEDYAYVTMYLLKTSGGSTIDEYNQITLIKYDGKWVVVDFDWPEISLHK